jgi:hypothetical protein
MYMYVCVCSQCRPLHIHREEQEEGDVRPDLDMALTISPVACVRR